jgi:SAM-dependent methyltransferase
MPIQRTALAGPDQKWTTTPLTSLLPHDRGRDHGPEFLDLWMDVVASHVKDQSTKTIQDLGCGTGRFTEALAVRFDADVIGVDLSKKMLAQARSKPAHGEAVFEPIAVFIFR